MSKGLSSVFVSEGLSSAVEVLPKMNGSCCGSSPVASRSHTVYVTTLCLCFILQIFSQACSRPTNSMVLTVNLIGPSPWGFRIFGGRDFKKAITVSKVAANSLTKPYQTISSVFVKTQSVVECHAKSVSSSLRLSSCLCLYARAASHLFP